MGVAVTTLTNGITVVTMPMEHVQSVSVIFYFHVGSRYESDAEAGMCHFIEHMLFKGTEHFPTARLLSEHIENVGGDFNASTGKEITDYNVRLSSEHVERAIAVLTDLVRYPLFEAAEMEKERRVILEEINMYKDSPSEWVEVISDELLFHGLPLGREVMGDRASVSAITQEQMRNFFTTHYVPSSLVVSVAGNIAAEETLALLEQYLGDWQGPTAPLWIASPIPKDGPKVSIVERDTEQANIIISYPAFSHTDPDHETLLLLDAILGDGMSSRLFQRIREEQGLSYDIATSYNSYHDVGSFDISAGCDPQQVDTLIASALEELQHLCNEPVSASELQRVKDYTRGRLLTSLEGSFSVANWNGGQFTTYGRLFTVAEIIHSIDIVTVADIQRVAQRIFRREDLCLAAIGPLPPASHFEALLQR